jgi:hypothetical protein
MAWHRGLRTDSKCEADYTTHYDDCFLHVRLSSQFDVLANPNSAAGAVVAATVRPRDERDLLVMTPASAGR